MNEVIRDFEMFGEINLVITSLERSAIMASLGEVSPLTPEQVREAANRRLSKVELPEIEKRQEQQYLDQLEEKGLIEKLPEKYALTPMGKEVIERLGFKGIEEEPESRERAGEPTSKVGL